MLVIMIAALLGSCFVPLVARVMGRGAGLVIALLPFGLFGAFVAMAPVLERGWVLDKSLPWAPSLGLDFALRLDGFSFLFCLLITGIGGLVVIYAGGYLETRSRPARARFFTLILLFMTAMLGTVMAENMLVLILFWEATSILSFLLIGFDGSSARARRAAIMALQVTAGGGLALVASVLMIGHVLGTYSMTEAIRRGDELLASPFGGAILAGILIASFTKSAQFPFHFWLPNAMQAPTPASAYLHSATMVKLGIYLLARFEPVIANTSWGRNLLITVACITMLVAAMQALRAESFKAALAYSTTASLGILVLLVGLDGPAATVAMIGFLLAHAMYKAALFFCAGSVLHATGLRGLRSLGGLSRALPLTAVACVGASLSMAGIPPFLGFISKEFLFEAQLKSSWEIVPLAIAVLVNAVMVGIAGVVTLRPFFLKPAKPVEIRHRESFSLGAPPLLLALAGLIFSLEPGWITRVAIRPAVAAVYGQPLDVDIAIWHGVTPMLLLSAVVVTIGVLIVRFWKRIHLLLRASDRLDRYGVEHLWERLVRIALRVARRVSPPLHDDDLRRRLWPVLAAIVFFLMWSMVATDAVFHMPAIGPLRVPEALVALIGVGGALAAIRARTLLATMVAIGLTGFSTAITFMLNGAPDLALTQFTVEALIVVLLTAILLVVPAAGPPERTPWQRGADALLAVALAGVLLMALLDTIASPNATPAADFYGRMSLAAAYGHNVVNVILVDFRALDTLGETTVIAMAAMVTGALLASGPAARGARGGRPVHYTFAAASGPLFWLLAAASIVILWRGHDQPGGGFVGGLVAALAFAILLLARSADAAERRLRISPAALVGAGLATAVVSGLPGLLAGRSYMTHLWWQPSDLLPKLGTSMLFDVGVYLVVLGAVMTFLLGLQRESER